MIAYVTGCLGFIGSHFVRLALKKGWRIYGVDKVTPVADRSRIKEFSNHPNFVFSKRDICELEYLYDCDYVINFAAESHVDNSISSSDEFMRTNILGVKNLLDLVRHKNITGGKPVFVQISTDEVYGDIAEGFHTEESMLIPSNPYSASKAAADMLVKAWSRTHGVDYLIVRPTNNYGVGQFPEKLIPLSIKNLERGRKIMLHDEGKPVRTWLHVKDTARAILTIIYFGRKNEIFNIAGHFEQANIDTVKSIIQYYFGCSREDTLEYIDFSYDRKGQDIRYAIDDSKLCSLGWRPRFEFEKELKFIVDTEKGLKPRW